MDRARTAAATLALVLAATALWPASAHAARRKKPNPIAVKYQTALKAGKAADLLGPLLAIAKRGASEAEFKGFAIALAKAPKQAPTLLRILLKNPSPLAAGAVAETLWRMAVNKGLSDPLATLAAELLDHPDPFVRALAEWAIATRVGHDNNKAKIRWPRPDPPAWFTRWMRLSPDAMVEADYVRFAIGWNIQHSTPKLLSSVTAVLNRAQGAAREVRGANPSQATLAMVTKQLAAIEAIRTRFEAKVKAAPNDITAHRTLWLASRHAARPIVMANPAIHFRQLLFVKRYPAHSHRNITGSQYPWSHKPGGDIIIQTGLEPGGTTRRVLDGKLGPGHVHGMDLWWDADRVVFAWARQDRWPPKHDTIGGNHVFLLRGEQEPTHIFEIRLDGSGLRQLTRHPYWSDFEPTYCANGDVAFASDRSGRSSECGRFSADHTVINLYAVSPDGKHIRRLSDNKDIDRYPHSLDNGTIAYTRWDYQERHFFEVHAIWTLRPDGTMSDAVFNQHIRAPYGLRDVRSVPASPKLIAVATGHHTLAYGPIVVVDPRKGINSAAGIRIVTPRVRPQEGPSGGSPVPEGGVPDAGGLYQTPWALSERCFLASYSHARIPSPSGGGTNTHGFAIYLLDAHGNKELIHRDLLLSCAFPIPLRKRPRPPILTPATDPEAATATCYITDVCDGAPDIPRGAVKHIRILQRVGWPLDDKVGAMRWIPGNAWERTFGFWAWAPVRVLGTVAVETDGSAHFTVPADTAVYFEALDERHMELRRMRSHVTFQPGEARGCRGCHETQARAPAANVRAPLALLRPASSPQPPPWGAHKLLGYEWLVQPILDRHCTRCHGPEKPDGGIDLSATPVDGFAQSFRTLFPAGKGTRPLVAVSNRFSGAGISRVKEFGSHSSPFITVLLRDALHRREVKLSEDEWQTLVTWVDANAPYHDTFYNRRPPEGGPPRRDIRIALPTR